MPGSDVIDAAHEPARKRRKVLEKALEVAAPRLGRQLTGEPAFGYQGGSIGKKTTTGEWLHVRVSVDSTDDIITAQRRVALADEVMPHTIHRPRELQADVFRHGGRLIYASLTELAPGRGCSRYSYLVDDDPAIDLRYLRRIREMCDELAEVHAVPPGRTLDVEFGAWLREHGVRVDLAFDDRLVGHGDLHWANLRTPDPYLIDWDYWGHVPVGYDAAELLVLSLAHPRVTALVQEVFGDLLDTPDGRRCQSLWCHTVLLAKKREGTFTALVPHVQRHLSEVLGEEVQAAERSRFR